MESSMNLSQVLDEGEVRFKVKLNEEIRNISSLPQHDLLLAKIRDRFSIAPLDLVNLSHSSDAILTTQDLQNVLESARSTVTLTVTVVRRARLRDCFAVHCAIHEKAEGVLRLSTGEEVHVKKNVDELFEARVSGTKFLEQHGVRGLGPSPTARAKKYAERVSKGERLTWVLTKGSPGLIVDDGRGSPFVEQSCPFFKPRTPSDSPVSSPLGGEASLDSLLQTVLATVPHGKTVDAIVADVERMSVARANVQLLSRLAAGNPPPIPSPSGQPREPLASPPPVSRPALDAVLQDSFNSLNGHVQPGTEFSQMWTLRWTGSSPPPVKLLAVHCRGPLFGRHAQITPVIVNGYVRVGIAMVAPDQPGEATAVWQLATTEGVTFGEQFSVTITVTAPASPASSAGAAAAADEGVVQAFQPAGADGVAEGGSPFARSQALAPSQSPYKDLIQQLMTMGFENAAENERALRECNGSLQTAIAFLTSE